jgi:transposase InsO family protein
MGTRHAAQLARRSLPQAELSQRELHRRDTQTTRYDCASPTAAQDRIARDCVALCLVRGLQRRLVHGFQGWFRTSDQEKCYPFTLLDAFCRMLLRCEALLEPNGDEVRRILDSAFREYGLPKRLRSDGGPPFFCAQSPANLSTLGIWILRLGVVLECIAPGKPEQNGRLERFHRTLKLEVEPATNVLEQQRRYDVFRGIYNFERPHAALSFAPPGAVYRRSPRKYPRPLLRSDAFSGHLERVDRRGFVPWRRKRIFIGEAFAFESLSLWPGDGDRWEVSFGNICIGHIANASATSPNFIPRRRPKGTMRLALEGEDDPVQEVLAPDRPSSAAGAPSATVCDQPLSNALLIS